MRAVGINNEYFAKGSYFRVNDQEQAQGFAANAKGDEKKEFENKHSDKAFRCEQEKKTADLSMAHTCRM